MIHPQIKEKGSDCTLESKISVGPWHHFDDKLCNFFRQKVNSLCRSTTSTIMATCTSYHDKRITEQSTWCKQWLLRLKSNWRCQSNPVQKKWKNHRIALSKLQAKSSNQHSYILHLWRTCWYQYVNRIIVDWLIS